MTALPALAGALRWIICVLAVGALTAGQARAGQMLDIDRELQLLRDGKAEIHIADARYRFAVFSYEDPDQIGLGNALATIVSHDLLMNGPVTSLGVLRYLGKLGSASGPQQLRYFDKVEPLIASQEVRVAVWGVIRRAGNGLQIDSYVQLSPAALRDAFSFTFPLPPGSGFAGLTHRVGPDRMRVQRLTLGPEAAAALIAVAAGMDKLRSSPTDASTVVATLPMDRLYYLADRRGDWLKVAVPGGGKGGWVRGHGICAGPCAPLLEVSRFAGGLMAYDARGAIPDRSANLAEDARIVIDQLIAVELLKPSAGKARAEEARRRLAAWCAGADTAKPGDAAVAGGAAACNLGAVAAIVAHDGWEGRWGDERLSIGALTPEFLRPIAQGLARASLEDPRHKPTLDNLSILFTLLGDGERAALAAKLAGESAVAR